MKITRFHIHKVTLRWRDLVFLEVQTDAGIIGLGEATLETRAEMAEAGLRWLEESFRGLDPSGVEKHWDRSYYQLSRWRNGPAANSALSAVDIALWDIEGKRLGVPVWRLLEGPIRNELRVYHTHWNAVLKKPRSPEAMGELAAETRAKGWTAVKWTIVMGGTEASRIASTVAELEAVRKAVGDSMDLCLEAAETFTPRSAIQFAGALAPYRPLFLEEPTLRENPAGLGEVAAKSLVPIATGEGLFSRFEFRQLLEARGAAIVQPDVMHAGGITEIRKIANLAESFGAEIAPHQCSGPIGHVASIHAMSVCHNFLIQEWEAADDALYTELTRGLYPVQRSGVVRLPEGPGLGISVDFAEFERRCPYR
ncbi:MAG: mandelate racemase/muconate lactonizing enzyme family protein, partial [Bryobacteraceae bacterium]